MNQYVFSIDKSKVCIVDEDSFLLDSVVEKANAFISHLLDFIPIELIDSDSFVCMDEDLSIEFPYKDKEYLIVWRKNKTVFVIFDYVNNKHMQHIYEDSTEINLAQFFKN